MGLLFDIYIHTHTHDKVVEPVSTYASEDFSYMSASVPGCYIWVGVDQSDRENYALHHPKYDFNDSALAIGSSLFVRLAEQLQPLSA